VLPEQSGGSLAVARGSVGHPSLEGINYWDELHQSPSQMEICFAVFANVLELDEAGETINEKYAERRAASMAQRDNRSVATRVMVSSRRCRRRWLTTPSRRAHRHAKRAYNAGLNATRR
jgi:hypothetical protein